MKNIGCYIYTRVSTAIQVDGYSLDAQKEKLRKYAEYQNYKVVKEFSFIRKLFDDHHVHGLGIFSKPVLLGIQGISVYLNQGRDSRIDVTAFLLHSCSPFLESCGLLAEETLLPQNR
jgi:site-specific DNA recombinase